MIKTLSCLGIVFLLAGCSTGVTSARKTLINYNTIGVGHRGKLVLEFEEPGDSDTAPQGDRRELYDRDGGGGFFLDQTVWIRAAWKF